MPARGQVIGPDKTHLEPINHLGPDQHLCTHRPCCSNQLEHILVMFRAGGGEGLPSLPDGKI